MQYLDRFVIAVYVLTIGVAAFSGLGTILSGPRLQRIVGRQNAADALCLLLLGTSLCLLSESKSEVSSVRRLGTTLGGTVGLLGLLNLAESFFHSSLLGHWVQFGGHSAETAAAISLHPINALIVSLLGFGLLFLDRKPTRCFWLAQSFAASASIISLLAILSLASTPYSAPSAMGFVNIASFLALSLALLAARPHCGLGGIVSGANAGGFLVRRLLPTVVVSQMTIAWVRGLEDRHSLWPELTATRLITLVILAAIVVWTAVLVNRIDKDRQRAAKAAFLSEFRHQLLFENMLEGIAQCEMIFDEQQRPIDFLYLAVNSTFTRITGLKDVVGKTASSVIPGIRELHPELFEIYGDVTLTGCPRKIEMEFRPLARWFSIAAHRAQQGQFVAVFEDVTERRKAEESTRELAAIVECSESAIISTGPDGVIRTWNHGATRLFGYGSEETRGKKMSFLDAPAAAVKSEDMLSRALQGETIQRLEIQKRRKDGSLIEVSLMIAPIRAPERKIVGASFISRDITNQKRGEEQSRLLQAALGATANAVIITDRDGRIQWTNRAFTALTGYEVHEVVGKTPRILRSGEHPPDFYAQMWQTILAGHVWSGEIVNRRKNGTLYTEEMTITPIQSDSGEFSHFVAVKQDITQRKSLEEQFRQAQKMEAVGTLAGGIAHDFNNLLGVIRGYCEMLDAHIGDNTDLIDIAQEIQSAVDSAGALTTQLLAFSRKQISQPRVVSLNEVVSKTVSLLRRVVGEDIVLTLQLGLEAGNVKVDPQQLQQVILNVAVNARDAMPNGGKLTVATANVDQALGETDIEPVSPGRYVRLGMRDTGMGMDQATVQRAFEPFFTTKPQGRGTGLGLACVYGIVKQSGGHVSLSSHPGEGTLVEIYLPRVDEKPATRVKEVPEKPSTGHETILLVEDYPALRKMIGKGLEGNGYRVIAAEDGNQALSVAASCKEPIDLLITDVIMPKMDGLQLARRLTERYPRLRVLYISGHTDEILGNKGVISSDIMFIKKPFELKGLLAKIREVLEVAPLTDWGFSPRLCLPPATSAAPHGK